MRRTSRSLIAAMLMGLGTHAISPPASAHTDADLVAVPAGATATVTLKPTHGCGESPTVEVAIRAPVEGALAGAVEGWTATQSSDGAGNTILEWTGGVLPSTEPGAFPVSFTAPDAAGELLTFPSIQTCQNGEELAWIGGDPAGDYPAPRLLILPAGFEPAATIDDVPVDAPGRDQLTAIVDVDNPAVPAGDSTTSTTSTTTSPTVSEPSASNGGSDDDQDGEGESSSVLPLAVGALAVAGGAVAVWMRRRRAVT